jgi:hypothetical protein
MSILVCSPDSLLTHDVMFPPVDVALNSKLFQTWKEEAELESLVLEMIQFAPEYAEQLAMDGMDRLRWA